MAELWPRFLDDETSSARPTLCLKDVELMIERGETPRFCSLSPRLLSDAELAKIKDWHDKAQEKLVADLGAPLASVQNTLAGQASANHEENVRLHEENVRLLEQTRAQFSHLALGSNKRLVVNRHAFVTIEEGVSNYFLEDGGVRSCEDSAPAEGRKYCKLVYVEQEKIGEPGVYYCTGQGTQKDKELHNWSMLVRVKTVEECVKPTLPKSLHVIQGQNATVLSEDGDMLRVRGGGIGSKVFSVRRGLVEFLPPDEKMATTVVPPQEEVRENAEEPEALAAPCPVAAAEKQSAPLRAARRTVEASTAVRLPKCRRTDHNNKQIRERRKQARSNAANTNSESSTAAAPAKSTTHDSPMSAQEPSEERPAKQCRSDPGSNGIQLTPETLASLVPDIVDDSGQLTLDRCMSLMDPLLALAMMRGNKQHEMRKQKWSAGAYLQHVGKTKTPPEFARKLSETWPDAPPSKPLPRSAIYGINWFGNAVPAADLSQEPWREFGAWGLPVLRSVEFAEPITGVSGQTGAWYLKDQAIKARVQAALSTGVLRTFQPS